MLHVTHHKAGSQWVYAVLKYLQPHRIVAPQVRVGHVLGGPLRGGAIYPTVYLSRPQVEALSLPAPSRTFVVLRDLRDTFVSFYFSLRYSHPLLTDHHAEARDALARLDEQAGMLWALEKRFRHVAAVHESWLDAPVPTFRYEAMLQDPLGSFLRIAGHCRLPVSEEHVRRAVLDCSFEKLSGRALGQEDVRSHYRNGLAGDWRRHLRGEVKQAFRERYGGLVVRGGYETGPDW